MRKFTFFFLVMALMVAVTYAQPQGFSYQTVVRDDAGNPITNQQVKFRFSIHQSSSVVYVETDTVTTNDFGLANLVIGQGQVVSGDFTTIDWSGAPCSLQVELDLQDGGGYHDMGTSSFLTVPYAQYAGAFNSEISGHAGEIQFNKNNAFGSNSLLQWNDTLGALGIGTHADTGRLVIQAASDAIDSLPLFQVKDKDGKTVFAVYNNSVHVFVDKEAKKRSYGAYKGGFVVSGKNSGAKANDDILVVNADSTRVFTQDEKAGFGVVGVSAKRGTSSSYMHITPVNYFIGENSGKDITTGKYNSTYGYETGLNLTTADRNVFMGYQAGLSDTAGNDNVFIGNQAGYHNISSFNNVVIGSNAGFSLDTSGNNNVIIGKQAGEYLTNGIANIFIGSMSGNATTVGAGNIFIGDNAGMLNQIGGNNLFLGSGAGVSNTSGNNNIFFGTEAGKENTTGYNNIFIGERSGFSGDTTKYNTFLGFQAGYKNKGDGNVFLGEEAGFENEDGEFNVYIGKFAAHNVKSGKNNVFLGFQAGMNSTYSDALVINSSMDPNSKPLIFGDFINRKVVINGDQGDNIHNRTLFVKGEAGGTSSWFNDSDKRLKKSIVSIPDALKKVMQLRGVNYYWKNPETHSKGLQMGFIAQEAEKVIPEVVSKAKNGYYAMQYAPITALLVEAVKAQQKQIEELKQKVSDLDKLKAEVEELKTLLGQSAKK